LVAYANQGHLGGSRSGSARLRALRGSLSQPHALLGIVEYDDGVYIGATVRLVHGIMPYRDFVFGHPPGILLLLLPLAILARFTGTRALMGAGRIETALVATANVFLLARLLRHRGLLAVVIAGGFLAVFPAGVFADNTVMLEPYVVLFCLLGASAMFAGDELAGRSRLLWAGLAFGFAGAVKIWAIFPAVIAIACCAPRFRHHLPSLLLGIAVGFSVPSLPFLLLAPESYLRYVVRIQLERAPSPGPGMSIGDRLVYMIGIPSYPSVPLAVAFGMVCALVVAASFLLRPPPTRLDWFALGAASLNTVALLAAPNFYFHYAYFSAAFLALLLGVSCDRLVRWVDHRTNKAPPWRNRRVASRLAAAVLFLVVVVVVAGSVRGAGWDQDAYDPGPAIADAIPIGACVVADAPALTIVADRFVARSKNCPRVVDSFFAWLVVDPENPPPSAAFHPSLIRMWRRSFSEAQYVVLSADPFRIPWSAELVVWFQQRFEPVLLDRVAVYRRRGPPAPK
jgi:alpha-1,2-mannosyltransferase